MPFVKIWIHVVWSTKNRRKLMPKEIRPKIFDHIHQNGLRKGILVDTVNGYDDHVHCLFRLKNDQTISKIMQLLKGESSYWVNQQRLIKSKFDWQDEYFAISVGESQVAVVRKYIQNQEEHHLKKTFQDEYDDFIKRYGFSVFKDNSIN